MSSFTSCVYFLAANTAMSTHHVPSKPFSISSFANPVRCARSVAGTTKKSAAHSAFP